MTGEPLTITRQVLTSETRPATLYDCRWAVLPWERLPESMHWLTGTGPDKAPWYGLRLTGDGRYICGAAWPDEGSAAQWCQDDRDALRESEEEHYQRTGELPAPMTPALISPAPAVIGHAA